jgi:phage terminase large subunit GpA-like protein
MLCAERLTNTIDRRGYTKFEWIKTRPRNEALDCRVYARAAAALVGADRWSDDRWDEERNGGVERVEQRPAPVQQEEEARPASSGSSFWD